MLKMIIADDEPLITQGIQQLVDWEQLGIRITGTYHNGTDALRALIEEPVDIAILDIAMPGKTGLDILRTLADTGVATKVIFLSGFQSFSYAQTAIRYGAMDYLLKPVKKELLIRAIRKCCKGPIGEVQTPEMEQAGRAGFIPTEIHHRIRSMGEMQYLLCGVELLCLWEGSDIERQMRVFSALGKLEVLLKRDKSGIGFQKNGRIWVVLVGKHTDNPQSYLKTIREELLPNPDMGFVYSRPVSQPQLLDAQVDHCLEILAYLFYSDYLDAYVLDAEKFAFPDACSPEQIRGLRNDIVKAVVAQNRETLDCLLQEYLLAACNASGGRIDATVYYLLSCIRAVEEHFETLSVDLGESRVTDAMDKARSARSYRQTGIIFMDVMGTLYVDVLQAMQRNENADIARAKTYIDEHYAENLSLEVMARHIHMNPFYFSSYFKKQTGENFKDYLNKIRMTHGMELLMLSDKKVYEIAEEVGFKDYRHFTKLFRRHYGKTPLAYRKQVLESKLSKDKDKNG